MLAMKTCCGIWEFQIQACSAEEVRSLWPASKSLCWYAVRGDVSWEQAAELAGRTSAVNLGYGAALWTSPMMGRNLQQWAAEDGDTFLWYSCIRGVSVLPAQEMEQAAMMRSVFSDPVTAEVSLMRLLHMQKCLVILLTTSLDLTAHSSESIVILSHKGLYEGLSLYKVYYYTVLHYLGAMCHFEEPQWPLISI